MAEFEFARAYDLESYVPAKFARDIILKIACIPNVTVRVDKASREYRGKTFIFGISGTRSSMHRVSGVIRVHFTASTTSEMDSKIAAVKEEMIKRKLSKKPTECKWISDKSRHTTSRLKGYLTYPDEPEIRRALLDSVPRYLYYVFKDGKCLNAPIRN